MAPRPEDDLPRRARWIAAAALLVAAAGTLLFSLGDSSPTSSSTAETRPGAARATAAGGARETAQVAPGAATEERDASAGGAPPSSAELVAIHGRLVLAKSGELPRNATVVLRTGDDSIDYRDLVERLGGVEAFRRLQKTNEVYARVAALGGWKPTFATRAAADGTFELRVPATLGAFTFTAEADGAVYSRLESFDLSPKRVADGYVLVLDEAASIEGALLDADGRPIAGGTLALRESRRAGAAFRLRGWRFRESDRDGRFAFPALGRGRYSVYAAATSCGPASEVQVELSAGAMKRIEIRLPAEQSLAGRVVDEKGAAVADVLVGAEPGPDCEFAPAPGYGLARTDGAGAFVLRGLGAGPHYLQVAVENRFTRLPRPDMVTAPVPWPADAPPLVLVLEEGRHVSGRVVDSSGAPIADALVQAEAAMKDWNDPRAMTERRQSVKTASDGTFRVTGLGSGPFVVSATRADVATTVTDGVPADGEVTLVVPGPTGIALRVVEATTGAPVEKYRATITGAGDEPWWRITPVETRDVASPDGSVDVRGLVAGDWRVQVVASGFLGTGDQGIVRVSAGQIAPRTLKLHAAATVRGKVVDAANGLPISGAEVFWIASGPAARTDVPLPPGSPGARSESDGTFELRDVLPGKLAVVASHERFLAVKSAELVATAGTDQEIPAIALRRGGAIEGTVIDSEGKPIARAAIFVDPSVAESAGAYRKPKQAQADVSGTFRVEGLPGGRCSVTAQDVMESPDGTHLGKRILRGSATVVEGATARVEFEAPATGGCRVTGRVTRAGEPIAGASIYVVVLPGRLFPRDSTAETDADGRFVVEHVIAGKARLSVNHAGGGTSYRDVVIPDASELEVDVALPRAAQISGRVVRKSDGQPLRGVQISAMSDAASGSASTDGDGRYSIPDLGAGRLRMVATANGSDDALARADRTVELAEGEAATVDFALESGGVVIVEVVASDGRPASGYTASLHPADSQTESLPAFYARSDDSGIARFENVAPGGYRVRVALLGKPAALSDPFRVTAGAETRVRVQLPRGV
ncbi:MAG TPA: carboxypeptidase regulatory-like domain-containing protein, partial [Planctomycetota bacterium]|nr:carboxypeptidase regulatory-like domain-containing protein [Planctomycetota bacterium]